MAGMAPVADRTLDVVIIGGGPAGLMAAEAALEGGAEVALFDAMPSLGRKFLLAGKGGLNLTHAEVHSLFRTRFDAPAVRELVDDFPAEAIRAWAAELGVATVVGSSRRVFPADYKAAPLLRRWITRLRARGLALFPRHHWRGWDAHGGLVFATPEGQSTVHAAATVLALGGASWPQLGSTGVWVDTLIAAGIAVTPLAPANAGITCPWSAHFSTRHAGAPLKRIRATAASGCTALGECVVTDNGLEGGVIYALGSELRRDLAGPGPTTLTLDLLPALTAPRVCAELAAPRGKRSLSEHLRRRLRLCPAAIGLLHECLPRAQLQDAAMLASAIKALPVRVNGMRPVAEAISTAGGIALEGLDHNLMVKQRPGLFAAGEMLDWEAPTGGYLLSASLATGRHAGRAAARWSALTH